MSNELKAPGLKSFWVRKDTGDGAVAGYIVEVLSCDKVSEEDDTILVTAQRVDTACAQTRLTLKVFYERFYPRSIVTSAGPYSRSSEHVHVVPEIHEAKLLRDQVERQKTHILNIEGALTQRNEHIKHLECDKNLCASQLAMQKMLLEFVEAFDKIPSSSIRCLGTDFKGLIEARFHIPIAVPLGPKPRPGQKPTFPYPSSMGAGVAMADTCDRLIERSKKAATEPVFVGVISDVTWNRLKEENNELPERIYASVEASKKDVKVGDHYKLYLGPCVPQCKLEATECEGRVFEAERALAEMKAKIESGEFMQAAASAINMLADAQAEAYAANTKSMGLEARVKELEAEKEDAWAHTFDEAKVTEDLEKETVKREAVESQLEQVRATIENAHEKLCNCSAKPGEIHAPMCYRRGGLLEGIDGLKTLLDIANAARKQLADDLVALADCKPCKLGLGAAVESKIKNLSDSLARMESQLYEYTKEGSGLAPILKASNGEICGICGGDVSKGAHTWKQCSMALEEESLKDVVRFNEVEAQRDAALVKLKANEDFLQTVLQERDHSQQVEVPDALQRAASAEHERDEEKGRHICNMNAVRLALEKIGVPIEWDVANQKPFPSGEVIKRAKEIVDAVKSSSTDQKLYAVPPATKDVIDAATQLVADASCRPGVSIKTMASWLVLQESVRTHGAAGYLGFVVPGWVLNEDLKRYSPDRPIQMLHSAPLDPKSYPSTFVTMCWDTPQKEK